MKQKRVSSKYLGYMGKGPWAEIEAESLHGPVTSLMPRLDWRGSDKVDEFCSIVPSWKECPIVIDNAVRRVLNPVNPCDYAEEGDNLIKLGIKMNDILNKALDVIKLDPNIDSALFTKEETFYTSEFRLENVKRLALTVFAERMVQECECKK